MGDFEQDLRAIENQIRIFAVKYDNPKMNGHLAQAVNILEHIGKHHKTKPKPNCKHLVEKEEDFSRWKECAFGLDFPQYGSCSNCMKYDPIPETEKVEFT